MPQIVDAHVHHWQPSVNDWYPLLTSDSGTGLGGTEPIARDYLPTDYRADSAAFDVTAAVHVSATSRPRTYLAEARWLDAMAAETGWPAATVGAVEPADAWEVTAADLAELTGSPLLRGVRVLFDFDPSSAFAHRLLGYLRDHALVFDLVVRPSGVPPCVELLDRFPELTVVVEHAGWPEGTDAAHFHSWQRSMTVLAQRPNVHCKISGLAMALHSVAGPVQGPWIESCLQTFGPERCMVGSNFPVDRLFGTYDELFATYGTVAEQLSADERQRLFAGTAREVYRL